MTTIKRRPKKPEPTVHERNVTALLSKETGDPKPYCTCTSIGGYVFDVQIGVYLHSDPKCWKPSKGYHDAAVRAGIL